MKEILISIQPKWVAKILNGEKTIEIRKTRPNCELPAKVYIYATKSKRDTIRMIGSYRFLSGVHFEIGKVLAEFTLNKVETIKENQIYNAKAMLEHACLTIEELNNYAKDKKFYAWHIEDLKIYDEPKELSEFGIKKAPQSWQYAIKERL